MTKYTYPAVFTPEENGAYSVDFPDLERCYTCGDNLTDSIMMAEDVLAFVLYGYERDDKTIPAPSRLEKVKLQAGEFVNYIACDTLAYRKMHSNKSVKKTLSIPEWLNEAAEKAGINFSGALQDAGVFYCFYVEQCWIMLCLMVNFFAQPIWLCWTW